MAYADLYKSGYLLRIKLAPAASSCGVRGIWQGVDAEYLKISVTTVAEKGKANKELIKLLAKLLKIPAAKISIISGMTDHLKKIYVEIPQTKENEQKIANLNLEKA
ncbi:MAG: DUF167 domain-containing protein [Alphaproteobacteria bacterium]|nr:DUF167 domain-containing protein [Alphaproteobacteria bacterium]